MKNSKKRFVLAWAAIAALLLVSIAYLLIGSGAIIIFAILALVYLNLWFLLR